ncbi:MAG: hypothetical protein Q8M31_17905 [Beijerinckiaceae bacterium]|nr:hypothetical protein [Beijerinckiaceae bacterium]
MRVDPVQDQAIAARMALIVGAATFDRLFAGARYAEVEGDLLFAFARDEATAAEIEERFALHISIIATTILKRDIGIVLVLPNELAR